MNLRKFKNGCDLFWGLALMFCFGYFLGFSRREVMPFCTFGWKGDVFSRDKPGKSDVL
jgi:hypothetical protein